MNKGLETMESVSPDVESTSREKRDKVRHYLEGIEKREESYFRLAMDSGFYADPDGIDPIRLLPENLRDQLLGKFKFQDPPLFINQSNEEGPLPPEVDKDIFSEDSDALITPGVLHYERGSASVTYLPSSIETRLKLKKDRASARFRITSEPGDSNKPMLGVDIETARGKPIVSIPRELKHDLLDRSVEVLPDNNKSRAYFSFLKNPLAYITSFQSVNWAPEARKEIETRLIGFWEETFRKLRNPSYPHFYPGQMAEKIPGLAVEIFSRAIDAAKKHEYAGVVASPVHFHDAEFLEKQGFRFEKQGDGDRLALLKIALRQVDKNRSTEASQRASAEGLPHFEIEKEAERSLLTPQERSWIVVLNSLRNKDLIPNEYNLGAIAYQFVRHALEMNERHLAELNTWERYPGDRNSKELDRMCGQFARLNWDKLKQELPNMSDSERALNLAQLKVIFSPLLIEQLEKQNEIFRRYLQILQEDGGFLEFPQTYAYSRDEESLMSRMTLYFNAKEETPKHVQDRFDELIEDEIITGDTLNPGDSYLAEFIDTKERMSPYIVVYHMYDKNGFVAQKDGSLEERKNVEHFYDVKRYIEALGLKTRVEKAVGNVRNPGPNRPYGWRSEEPSVWTDELHGIEHSEQNVLVISCSNIAELERVAEYLHKVGYKTEEDEKGTNPSWYVPDIRILGFPAADVKSLPENSPLKQYFAEAVLHAQKGKYDGWASTLAHETHRLVSGFQHIPVIVHGAMSSFIKKDEDKLGAYEFVGR